MIIKVDNRETALIPLIEHRMEIFMNSNTDSRDLHEGVDDGIADDDKVSVKKQNLESLSFIIQVRPITDVWFL